MKRIIVSSPLPPVGSRFSPDRQETHHLKNVRRVRHGERIEVLDGMGGLVLGAVHLKANTLQIEVLESVSARRESPLCVHLALAVPTHRKTLDQLLPAVVQLGVTRLWLVETRYSGRWAEGADKRIQRWNQIALEALKQSGRLVPPEILMSRDVDEVCAAMDGQLELNIIFHPDLPNPSQTTDEATPRCGRSTGSLPSGGAPPDGLGIMIGPEGGFTEAEVEAARSWGFWVSYLGPRMLRTETAVVGACFWAQAAFGDLGGGVDGR